MTGLQPKQKKALSLGCRLPVSASRYNTRCAGYRIEELSWMALPRGATGGLLTVRPRITRSFPRLRVLLVANFAADTEMVAVLEAIGGRRARKMAM
jgi:hypothetical protein